MDFKVNVKGLKELNEVLVKMQAEGAKATAHIESHAPVIAEAAEMVIMQAIANMSGGPNGGFGNFMAVRTKVVPEYGAGVIVLTISGMSEGEAGFPPVKGGEVKNPATNLWAGHEFGQPSDGHSSEQGFVKDVGGVNVYRTGVGHAASSPYVGKVQATLRGLTTELQEVIRGVGGIIAGTIGADIVTKATGGKIVFDRGAKAAMRRAGVNESTLASLGVARVNISPTGQINLLGTTSTGMRVFLSGKGAGIPTTINR